MIDYGRFTLLRGRWYARALLVFTVFAFTLFVDCKKCLKGEVLKGNETKVLGPYDMKDVTDKNVSCGWFVKLNDVDGPEKCSFMSVELLSVDFGELQPAKCKIGVQDIRCTCVGDKCNTNLEQFPQNLAKYLQDEITAKVRIDSADYDLVRCFMVALRFYFPGLGALKETQYMRALTYFLKSNEDELGKTPLKAIYDEALTTSTTEAPTTFTSSTEITSSAGYSSFFIVVFEPTTEAPEEAGFDFADWFVNGNLGSLTAWICGMAPIMLIPILFNMAGYHICPVFVHKSTFSLGKSPFFDDGMPAPMDDVTVTSSGDLTIQKAGREKAGVDVEAPKEPTPAEAAAAAKKASHKASRKAAKAAKKEAASGEATTSGASGTADAFKEAATSDVSKAAASADAAKAAPSEVPAQDGKTDQPTRESILEK